MSGDAVLERRYIGTPQECAAVVRADPEVEISTELLRDVIAGAEPTIRFGEGVLRFGTAGEGLGVVTYEIDDPRFMDWHDDRCGQPGQHFHPDTELCVCGCSECGRIYCACLDCPCESTADHVAALERSEEA